MIAATPQPPYTAVVFTSVHADLRPEQHRDYDETTARMLELVAGQPGYLGVESARGPDGGGITVSYWRDDTAAAAWKRVAEHLVAQRHGRTAWYAAYRVRVATVTRTYGHAPVE